MQGSNLLAITPSQFPLESPCGFILRVTEANLYRSPHYIAKLANHDHRDLVRQQIDMRKIAAVLGCHPNALHGYKDPASGQVALCGHPMPLNSFNLNQRICAACIRERGYRPAWMDLRVVDACPIHRTPLQTGCHACRQALPWARPGLLKCNCGADLCETAVAPEANLTSAHIALLDATVREFEGERGVLAQATLGVEFFDLSFANWLAIFEAASFLQRKAGLDASGAEVSNLRRASTILMDWSVQLSEVMRRLVPEIESGAGFGDFSRQVGGLKRTWSKCLSADVFRRVVARSEALPLSPGPVSTPLELESWQYPEHLAPPPRMVRTNTPVQTRRVAAKAAGLPVPVLDYLLARNLFKTTGGKGRTIATAEDAVAFHKELSGLAQARPAGRGEEYEPLLESVRLRKFGTSDAKGGFMAAVLRGEVPIFRGRGAAVEGLVVSRARLETFIKETHAVRFDGTLPVTEMARRLDVTQNTVYGLVADGVLVNSSDSAQVRISLQSAQEFEGKYVSLSVVRKTHSISARRCIKIAIGHGLNLVRWSSLGASVWGTYFVSKVQSSLLDEAISQVVQMSGQKPSSKTHYFQDPSNPQNRWAGIGRRPRWLMTYLEAGRPPSEFMVRNSPTGRRSKER